MSTLDISLSAGFLRTNFQGEAWEPQTVTPSSMDGRLQRLSRGSTPITSLGRIGNLVAGAAAGTVLLAGSGPAPRPLSATAITSPLRQGAAESPTELARAAVLERSGSHFREEPSALDMIEELKIWLSVADEDVARIARVARRTLTNWRSGTAAYPSTARRVAAVHALVGRAVVVFGDPIRARSWLNDEMDSGKSRLAVAANSDDGLARVLEESASFIFARPAALDFASGLTERAETEVVTGARRRVAPPAADARRVRRPPVGGDVE